MKFSSKVQKCNLSPIRKFYPYQVEAKKRGTKIYHLNIGQPDIETPQAYFDAIKHFEQPVLEYAPSPGIPEMIEAVKKYYANLNIHLETNDVIITTGGSEALSMALNCILDDGDEIIIPEPFYPNYNTCLLYTSPAQSQNTRRCAHVPAIHTSSGKAVRILPGWNPAPRYNC